MSDLSPAQQYTRRELYLLRKLRLDMPACDHSNDELREAIRTAILERKLGSVVTGRGAEGEGGTYARAFAALYGQSLQPPGERP